MIIVNDNTTLELALPLMGYDISETADNETTWENQNVRINKLFLPGRPRDQYAVRICVRHPHAHPPRVLELNSRRWSLTAILHVIDACWAGRNDF